MVLFEHGERTGKRETTEVGHAPSPMARDRLPPCSLRLHAALVGRSGVVASIAQGGDRGAADAG
jgi:hypothetical protein